MYCEKAMDSVVEKLGDGPLSLEVHLHLLRCPSCRAEAARLRKAARELATLPFPAAPDLEDSIMAAIRREQAPEPAPIAFRDWVAVGVLIAAAAALSPLGATFGWLVGLLGSGLTMPIALTMGIALTAYCALFIGTHLDELSERFHLERGVQ